MTETLAVSAGSVEFGQDLEAEVITIQRAIDLTAVGELPWVYSQNEFGNPCFVSEVDFLNDKTISAKLDLARMVIEYEACGYICTRFARLLITSTMESTSIVDVSSDTDADRVNLANTLFRVVEVAISTDEDKPEGQITDCNNCGRETGHRFYPSQSVEVGGQCHGNLRCVHCDSLTAISTRGLQKNRI